MTIDYQVNLRKLTISVIRVYAVFQFVTMFYRLADLLWYLFKQSGEAALQAAMYQNLRGQVVYMFINSGVMLLIYFQANRIAGWMFVEDEPIVWSGDPFEFSLPALQITGLVFITMGLAGLPTILQTLYLHVQGDASVVFDPKYWENVWSVFLHLLLGFLFFRNPRWLVDRMRRFSMESH